MIWADKRDHLELDMTPLSGMPSSLVGYIRALLVWFSIQTTSKFVMMQIRGENNRRNRSYQRSLRGALKYV